MASNHVSMSAMNSHVNGSFVLRLSESAEHWRYITKKYISQLILISAQQINVDQLILINQR